MRPPAANLGAAASDPWRRRSTRYVSWTPPLGGAAAAILRSLWDGRITVRSAAQRGGALSLIPHRFCALKAVDRCRWLLDDAIRPLNTPTCVTA